MSSSVLYNCMIHVLSSERAGILRHLATCMYFGTIQISLSFLVLS